MQLADAIRGTARRFRGTAGLFLFLAAAGCAGAPKEIPPETEERFRTLESGAAIEAYEAAGELQKLYDDSLLPRLERVLGSGPRAAARGLQLIGDLDTEGSEQLLADRFTEFLASDSKDVRRMALSAAGLRRLRAATGPIIEQFEELDEKASVRALGRIWERKLDAPPLPRREEIDRLGVLALLHRLAMTASSNEESCGAMFRVMTGDELADFLGKHAGDKFFARKFCEQAAGRPGFDPRKGVRIHEALLSSPDPRLVASILTGSPHALRPPIVRSFLDDRRPARGNLRVCDAAARRLTRKPLPPSRAARDALIRSLKSE